MKVAINIGILTWHVKVAAVKPLRGKRVSLRVPCTITYDELSQKAIKRFNDFHKSHKFKMYLKFDVRKW